MQAPKMTLSKLWISLATALGALVLGGVAYAGCTSGCPVTPPTCCAPPPAPPRPPTPPSNCNTCGGGGGGGGGHNVYVPGINIHVGGSVVVNANASATSSASSSSNAGAGAGAGASAGSTVYYGGGTHGGYYSGPVSTGYIQGLNVEGGDARRRASYEATRSTFKRVVIRAVCLDDRDVPHPASQVTPDRDIDSGYDGELYRCIAGSRMQYVIGAYEGYSNANFGGETYVCGKNEALYYGAGAGGSGAGLSGGPDGRGGALSCRPQRPARDCNERSLLRRYGAGVKVLTILTTEKYTAYREETVREQSSQGLSLSLDGGVGGVVY